MEISNCGSVKTRAAPQDWFTGTVWLEPIVETPAPARLRATSVAFTPQARTAWHTHPLGQTLYVTSGAGLAQSWGKPAQVIRAGDSVWIPPGEKHWHGAGPATAMTHVAMQEALDGTAVEWMEKVADAHYLAAAKEAGLTTPPE